MKINKQLGLLTCLLGALCPLLSFAGPYDTWSNYKVITVAPTTATTPILAQTNFPLLVRLRADSNAVGKDVLQGSLTAGGLDVVFTDSTGTTALNFERERWTATNDSAEFWVLLPQINGSDATTKIRVYWGKGGAGDLSNSRTVFDTSSSVNSYRAVWHMNGASNTSDELDATANGFTATQFLNPGAKRLGGLGYSRNFDTSGTNRLTWGGKNFVIGKSQTNRAVYFTNSTTGYAAGLSGLVLKTTDAGATWTTQKTYPFQSQTGVNTLQHWAITCKTGSSDTCYAAGGNGSTNTLTYVSRTTDGGATWAKVDSTASRYMITGISCVTGTRCVAVGGTSTNGYLLDSTTNGTTWAGGVSTTGRRPLLGVSCIAGGDPSTGTCFAAGGAPGFRYVLKSTNTGVNFTKTDSAS
ncbi:MAG TPA: hypothetical protein DCQ83_09380, partial [Fibrobacteres bacterium]|nr:hypothetical protein [Fibrobacterota bacterium]